MIEGRQQKERLLIVLERYTEYVEECEDADEIEYMSSHFERMLNELQFDDFFGTESQLDFRGDGRNDNYSMWRVAGYDD